MNNGHNRLFHDEFSRDENNDDDQTAADSTFAALNQTSDKEIAMSDEERQTLRLGSAIRQAVQAQSIESNASLRELITKQMAEADNEQKVIKQPSNKSASLSARHWVLILTVSASIVSLGWFGIRWLDNPASLRELTSYQVSQPDSAAMDSSNNPAMTALAPPQANSPAPNEVLSAYLFHHAGNRAGGAAPSGVFMVDSSGSINSLSNLLPKQMSWSAGFNSSKSLGETVNSPLSRGRRGWDFDESSGGEQYDAIIENEFVPTVDEAALSTFSIDVDTASYANVRRFINSGGRPPANAVRIEEMINYFKYDYPQPDGDVPFSVNMEVAPCSWNQKHQLLRIGLKGKEIHRDERPVSNLVFLLDVSGSMSSADKLPLLKRGLMMMIDQLNENDRVSIVTYAGNAGLVLPPTSGDQKRRIITAIESLASGGSTHGSAGINMAYQLAGDNFIIGGTNRVIWATDGDLNVGITADQDLVQMVKRKASDGVFLTVLGFGTGNLKDSKLEKIADNGNGVYAYVDSMREAHKVLVEQMSGSLVTIAKDVKLQIEFNPAEVKAYRMIGYENRVLATKDFDDDKKDAGDIGAGHTVTALYELVTGDNVEGTRSTGSTPLKYQVTAGANEKPSKDNAQLTDAAKTGELLTLALRYKLPEANESTRIEFTDVDESTAFDEASSDYRFAASVAAFGMILRGSKHRGNANLAGVEAIAISSIGDDDEGYRAEFLDLVRRLR